MNPLADLFDALGRQGEERVAICHLDGATFSTELSAVTDAPALAAQHTGGDCWYSAQPIHPRVAAGRGSASDVVGLRELYADLDCKADGARDEATIGAIVRDLSAMLGAEPVAAVYTGHGWQPHWRLADDPGTDWTDETDPRWLDAYSLLRRWGRLAALVAQRHHARVDNVYDLTRVLRVPGTVNRKDPTVPVATVLHRRPGTPVHLDAVLDALDAYGITEWPEDRLAHGETLAPAEGWGFAPGTCQYVRAMIRGWGQDTPPARHPWLVSGHVRLAAAHRLGCIARENYDLATVVLINRFRQLLTGGEPRTEGVNEIRDAAAWAVEHVQTLPEAQARRELGDHRHDEDAAPDAAFWQARKVLAHIQHFARQRRVCPWALLGVVLARVLTRAGPSIQLPALVGSNASLNLFVALVGPSGSGKSTAIHAGTDAVDVGEVVTRSPGSGEGIAHMFVHRVQGELEQHTTAVLFSAAEVEVLTALIARQGSILGGVLREVYDGAQLGYAFSDSAKRLVVARHAYRLCMIVGVQPEKAAPLLDEAHGGTPQRFLWLPAVDKDAPDIPPAEIDPWPWSDPTFSDSVYLDPEPRVLAVCAAARELIDTTRLETLRGNGHALNGHALLTRLKVAAGLGLLDGHAEVTDEDWALADHVMQQSDETRQGVINAIKDAKDRQNRARAQAEGDRAVVVSTTMEDAAVARVGNRLVARLTEHGDWMTGSELRRMITSKDRQWFDDALTKIISEGRVEFEDVPGQGTPGRRYKIH